MVPFALMSGFGGAPALHQHFSCAGEREEALRMLHRPLTIHFNLMYNKPSVKPVNLILQRKRSGSSRSSRAKKKDKEQLRFFSPNSKTLLCGLWPRLAPVRSGAASTPGSEQGSGGFWCRYLVRFRRVPVQIPCEVPEVSGAGTRRF